MAKAQAVGRITDDSTDFFDEFRSEFKAHEPEELRDGWPGVGGIIGGVTWRRGPRPRREPPQNSARQQSCHETKY